MKSNNDFSLSHLKNIIQYAKSEGYTFRTIKQFLDDGCPEKTFIMKHDLDTKPARLRPLLDLEKACGIRSTIYVRVTGDYNVMGYDVFPTLLWAAREGFEIGLHTSLVEYGTIVGLNPLDVLDAEVTLLKKFFPQFNGMSTHRDLNYMYNSLPFVEENWKDIQKRTGLLYQAYDKRIMNENIIYVNESYSPHLGWRNMTPIQAIETGKIICTLTHPHWWFKTHAFET